MIWLVIKTVILLAFIWQLSMCIVDINGTDLGGDLNLSTEYSISLIQQKEREGVS